MTNASSQSALLRRRFADLHKSGTFLMPNAWDIGSARILASLGFPAIATTSSGFAASLGRMDQRVTINEVAHHVRSLVRSVQVPLSVDAERCYADNFAGVQRTVKRLAEEGAAGVSIEDYDPVQGIYPIKVATARVKAPVNVLLRPSGPSVAQLAEVGVRRLSTGGSLAFAAYGALAHSARELLTEGTSTYAKGALSVEDRRAAFEG